MFTKLKKLQVGIRAHLPSMPGSGACGNLDQESAWFASVEGRAVASCWAHYQKDPSQEALRALQDTFVAKFQAWCPTEENPSHPLELTRVLALNFCAEHAGLTVDNYRAVTPALEADSTRKSMAAMRILARGGANRVVLWETGTLDKMAVLLYSAACSLEAAMSQTEDDPRIPLLQVGLSCVSGVRRSPWQSWDASEGLRLLSFPRPLVHHQNNDQPPWVTRWAASLESTEKAIVLSCSSGCPWRLVWPFCLYCLSEEFLMSVLIRTAGWAFQLSLSWGQTYGEQSTFSCPLHGNTVKGRWIVCTCTSWVLPRLTDNFMLNTVDCGPCCFRCRMV